MRYLFLVSLLFSIAGFGQKKNGLDAYFSVQYNATTTDRTITNNSSGPGLGLTLLANTKSSTKPILQLNGYLFTGTKELYVTSDREPIEAKELVSTIFAGASRDLGKQFLLSLAAGPAFYNTSAHFGFRPAAGLYTSNTKKVFFQTSYTYIFQRDKISNQGFGFVSFALGLKLF